MSRNIASIEGLESECIKVLKQYNEDLNGLEVYNGVVRYNDSRILVKVIKFGTIDIKEDNYNDALIKFEHILSTYHDE